MRPAEYPFITQRVYLVYILNLDKAGEFILNKTTPAFSLFFPQQIHPHLLQVRFAFLF